MCVVPIASVKDVDREVLDHSSCTQPKTSVTLCVETSRFFNNIFVVRDGDTKTCGKSAIRLHCYPAVDYL
jgi:hypothetical protein